ncbi:hypothetical protein [Streptomyces hoynatensis]|uniref:Glycolipid-binding domain-containing protein n=1 Tax=Streptomyces hoynatensis TaxID=1141874 RepID=A0A3A9YPM5_9ACTN|nr:hypothetical protein [Streptomyces hoynatensis]RKN37424.1 hypothetical protein D7294_28225 [Streptomyces hoynatensis]
MPRGRYSLHDPHDGTPLGEELFQCAPGPTGWRYVSRTGPAHAVDLTLDALGRPLRLELRTADWQVRGAALDGVTWVRQSVDGTEAEEGNADARAFTGVSPAFRVATAHLLRLTPATPTARVRLLDLAPPVLAPRTRDETWTLLGSERHDTDAGQLTVEHYRVDDLETGERHTVHLAGDVLLAAPGVELEELDSPPSRLRPEE